MRQLLRFNTFTTIFTANWYFQHNAKEAPRQKTRICWTRLLFLIFWPFLLSAGPVETIATTSLSASSQSGSVDPVSVESGVPDFATGASSGVESSKDEKKPSSTSQNSPKSTSTVETSLVNMKPSTSSHPSGGQAHSDDDNDDQLSDQIKTEGGECECVFFVVVPQYDHENQYDLWPWPRASKRKKGPRLSVLLPCIALYVNSSNRPLARECVNLDTLIL